MGEAVSYFPEAWQEYQDWLGDIVAFLGREFLSAWFTGWISGICLTLTAMGLSWTAIVLSWEQTSFWRFKVECEEYGWRTSIIVSHKIFQVLCFIRSTD